MNLDGAYTNDTGGEGKVLTVNYPYTWSWNGTNTVKNPGNTYTYSFDAMMRPTGLTDQNNNTLVNNVTYNAANQLLTFNSETRQYNNLNQMTHLTITGALDINYNFPAGTNNGKISTQTDNLSGETVTYQYDSLNRLLSATSNQSWSETYGFDGFGNLLSKTGTGGAPTLSQSVDTATNHIVGQSYDSNGNQASGPLGSVTYDAENRVASVPSANVQYAYDSQNKRIWSSTLSGGNLTQTFYYYGTDGQKLGIYPLTLVLLNNVTPLMTDNSNVKLSTFFGSKRIGAYDRLGSAKYDEQNSAAMLFYPYGEDRGTVQPNDSLKFATYTRDSATGLDYADQRYYASNFGRLMSADRHSPSSGGRPLGWNRYTYVLGDPVNLRDKLGLEPEKVEDGDDGGDGTDDGGGDDFSGGGGGGPGDSCGPGWETDASLSGPCCPGSSNGFAPGDPSPSPACPAPVPQPVPAPQQGPICSDWTCMPAAYSRAILALTTNPGCMDLFGNTYSRSNGWNPVNVLTDIVWGTHKHGSIVFKNMGPGNAAVTTPSGYGIGLLTGKATITINSYVDPTGAAAYWNAGFASVNAEVLLHELAHLYTLLRGSGGFDGTRFISDATLDALIQTNCFPGGLSQ